MNKQSRVFRFIMPASLLLFLLSSAHPACAQIFLPDLSATTDAAHKVHVSLFQSGPLQITATGQISLSAAGWQVLPDGSSFFGVTDPAYKYAIAGASGYPTNDGG